MLFGARKEKFLKEFPHLFRECCQTSPADGYLGSRGILGKFRKFSTWLVHQATL